jgi:glycosyltransferase involved in cell wall biosynthesis
MKEIKNSKAKIQFKEELPEILFITSFPERECGIATYSQDLISALNNKFDKSFKITVCPIESKNEKHIYPPEIKNVLDADISNSYLDLANKIEHDNNIKVVLIQHEFGFFANNEDDFIQFLFKIKKPIIIVFHTVLPSPNDILKEKVQQIAEIADSIIVMTKSSKKILINDYDVIKDKITLISHGTHLVPFTDKNELKEKYNLVGRKILATFGLLSSGKSIETTLKALPEIVKNDPLILFLIIGKTHPSLIKQEGEKYRDELLDIVEELNLTGHVKFINQFLPLPELLDYLQLTDIYLFTSKDPNQAVSGTFSYAISSGCPIISTPIPHALELLFENESVIFDFENSEQLALAVNKLMIDESLRKRIILKSLERMASTAWENSAIAHAILFEKIGLFESPINFNLPEIKLDHIKNLTTDFGMIQFSKINKPDIDSGYTLDDNARAMIVLCQHFEITKDENDLKYIYLYFDFIKYCLQSEGYFLNYVDEKENFTEQNNTTNLADSNGRAIWALGYLISLNNILPLRLIIEAEATLEKALSNVYKIHSTRAMAFVIKGLYYNNKTNNSEKNLIIISELANRLVQMFKHEKESNWLWFESYLTYANSLLPEALLCAFIATDNIIFKEVAKDTFDFLLSKTFEGNNIKVISNKGWLKKGEQSNQIGGEQPIDVAYTILTLSKFYSVFKDENYKIKMINSFNWFLGKNHLKQTIYNPCTGGCYDGLEENNVNLNQGAESTVSYLMARLTLEKHNIKEKKQRRESTLSI